MKSYCIEILCLEIKNIYFLKKKDNFIILHALSKYNIWKRN